MNPAVLMVCKGFLEKAPPEVQQHLISLLPPEEQNLYSQLPHPASFEGEHLQWDLLEEIHFTWLAPYMRTLSEGDVRLFLSALSERQRKGLQKLLGFSNHDPELNRLAKEALRKILHDQLLQNQTLVPFAFLPDHPLNALLRLDEKKLTRCARYLGLHDLSTELRQIISTAELKKIYAALTKKESDYLNRLTLQKEPLIFKRQFLQPWDGSKQHLRKLLQERGLHRLGHLLWDASESLTWYLSHKFDMHPGTLLLKYREKPVHERSEKILLSQVERVLEALQPEEAA